MKATISYKFNFKIIKNHIYFLVKKDPFTSVYFMPIIDKILFVSPCKENIYMTMSIENKDVNKINKYIKNTIKNGAINFNHIFAIDKKEFVKFLKNTNTNNNSYFIFEIIIENNSITANCCIPEKEKRLYDLKLIKFLSTNNVTIKEDELLKDLLEFLFLKEFKFNKIHIDENPLNIKLRYYSSIYKWIKSFKDWYGNVIFAKDDINQITSIVIEIDNEINLFTTQILVSNYNYDYWHYYEDRNILSNIRKIATN